MRNWVLIVGLSSGLMAAEVKAPLIAEADRKGAAEFSLTDSSGKSVSLKNYRGKVVLLDFWATWCTGCKLEMPWFEAFQKQFGAKGLAVVGVSLDEDGWKTLRPFLESHPVAYRIVLGDQKTAKTYGIENMPDTFLIDRKGRIAAAYRGAIVDRADIETNIRALIAK